MILKDRDGLFADIERLSALAAHPGASARQRIEIEDQIRRLKSGERGEAGVAYHLKTFFGASKNWIVLNDLRIEHDGVVAQIDHLLIGRLLDIWVCESKNVADGLKINDHGEFITFYNRKPRAMASPIEQTQRHIHVLKRLLDSGGLRLPTRLGLTLRPRLRGLVLIANGTITRPKIPVPGIEMVIKAEHLQRHVTSADDGGNPLDLAKFVSFETLKDLGEQMVALHRPITFDWEQRIRLKGNTKTIGNATTWQSPEAYLPKKTPPVEATRRHAQPASRDVAITKPSSTAADGCASCGAQITSGVRSYCLQNAARFNGGIYCMACQPKIGKPAGD